MDTTTSRPTRSRVDAANAARARGAATKACIEIVNRLRHLPDAELATLIEVAQEEQQVRRRAAANDDEVGRT